MARPGIPSGGGSSGLARLVHLVDRYGPAIEFDLHHELHLDLLDFFRRVFSWAKLERLLDQLPSSSRFRCAMADDDEVADAIVKRGKLPEPGRTPPPLRDVDFHASLLMVIADRLDGLAATIMAVNGAKPGQVVPLPRPVSAIDRARRRAERAEVSALNAEVYAAMDRWTQQHAGGGHG